ncbi:MAG: DUF2569 family protein [Ignavibacteria bacterium]|nr:DUF2569 family protein [Ignavibacteria bacterium]
MSDKKINTNQLGGWLIAIQVFIILNAISWVGNLQLYYKLLGEKDVLIKENGLNDPSILNVFFYYELAASLVFTFLAFVVFYYFFKRNKLFPLLMTIYLISEVIVEGLSFILFGYLSSTQQLIWQKLTFSIVVTIVIIIYLKKSERVKQTFVF